MNNITAIPFFLFCLQGNTEAAVASVLALTQNSAAVVDPTSVTIAVTILSQNTSALQDDTVIESFQL